MKCAKSQNNDNSQAFFPWVVLVEALVVTVAVAGAVVGAVWFLSLMRTHEGLSWPIDVTTTSSSDAVHFDPEHRASL